MANSKARPECGREEVSVICSGTRLLKRSHLASREQEVFVEAEPVPATIVPPVAAVVPKIPRLAVRKVKPDQTNDA